MTLLQVIDAIEKVAAKQPAVNTIVRENIYLLNERTGNKYGVFCWSQGTHGETTANDFRTYRFTFYYADRMTENAGNRVECQSVGLDTLGNIIRELAEVFDLNEWTLDTFADKLGDLCAGAYATLSFRVIRGNICPQIFSVDENKQIEIIK